MTFPGVTLGGVPLMKQRIAWTWSPGAAPNTFTLTFPREDAERIFAAADGKGFLHFRMQHEMLGAEDSPKKVDVIVPNLYLVGKDGTNDPYTVQLRLADPRILLTGLKVSGTFNMRRETADRRELAIEPSGVRVDPTGAGLAAIQVKTGPNGEFGTRALDKPGAMTHLFRLAGKNYLEWTINADGSPKTALDICRSLLGLVIVWAPKLAQGVARDMLAALSAVTDNQHVEVDVVFREEGLPEALGTWLAKAEVGLAPLVGTLGKKGAVQGGFRAYRTSMGDAKDPDFQNMIALGMIPPEAEGGYMDLENKRLVRAPFVHVAFPRANEVLLALQGHHTISGEVVTRLVPRREAYNVLQLPDTLTVAGRTWVKGTWVSVRHALGLWVDNGDLSRIAANPFSKRIGKTSTWVEQHWFPSGYLRMMGYTVSGLGLAADPVWGPRLAELEKRFLQTWMIDPVLMQYVLEVKNQRAAIVDTLTGEPAPAYVSSDHAEIYEVGLPEYRLNPRARAATNVPASKDPSKATGAPASLTFEREGVFTINWDSSYSGRWLKQVVPTLLEEDTIPPVLAMAELMNAGNPLIKHAWHQAHLQPAALHKGFVILLMTFGALPPDTAGAVPRDLARQRRALFFQIPVKGSAVGFSGKTNDEMRVEVVTRQDSARFALADPGTGKGAVDNLPVNNVTIEALAQALARQYYHQQHDRVVGRFTVPGFDPQYRLFGSMRSLTVTIEENSKISTTFDFAPPPIPPAAGLITNPDVKLQLYGLLPQSRSDRAK